MNGNYFKSKWIEGELQIYSGKIVQISVVAYEHILGVPARFCTGLIPAIALSKELKSFGVNSIIRLIDPTPIANHCNDWNVEGFKFKDLLSNFLNFYDVEFFFDEAEQISNESLVLLETIGQELLSTTDISVQNMVQRIKDSGKKHGGDLGEKNSILYMAAHPFSWLDMYHPLVWKKEYPDDVYQFINLMSKSESRFTLIRKFLCEKKPTLCTNFNPVDAYMTVCDTPCYIPLEGEPTFNDLTLNGYEWCHQKYKEIKNKSGNHRRALKDFEALVSFLEFSKVS